MKSVSLKITAAIIIVIVGVAGFQILRIQGERRTVSRARADLGAVRIDDQRHDRGRLAVYNPTEWELFDSRNADSIAVEYFGLIGEYRQFLCKDEVGHRLKAQTYNDLNLYPLGVAPSQTEHISAKAPLLQKVTIRFDRAQKGEQIVRLDPGFELVDEREFVFHQSGYVLEADPSDPFNFAPARAGQVSINEFASRVKRDWQDYADFDELMLVGAVVTKWPVYRERIIDVDRAIESYKAGCTSVRQKGARDLRNFMSDMTLWDLIAEFGEPK